MKKSHTIPLALQGSIYLFISNLAAQIWVMIDGLSVTKKRRGNRDLSKQRPKDHFEVLSSGL